MRKRAGDSELTFEDINRYMLSVLKQGYYKTLVNEFDLKHVIEPQ
ncbi:hypothetical protein [Veillonella intestinalis]|nr:hypothetical protein [Veillonella intestinalis]